MKQGHCAFPENRKPGPDADGPKQISGCPRTHQRGRSDSPRCDGGVDKHSYEIRAVTSEDVQIVCSSN